MRTQLQTFGGDDPVWAFVGRLRAERFTGSATLRGPQIDLFATDGHVYLAERRGEPTLPQRLLAAGVVTAEQLERGTVEVAGTHSLARLFHRDPTVDRDLVELFVQLATDAVLADAAEAPLGPVDVAHLRHHPSGVHLWVRSTPQEPTDAPEPAAQPSADAAHMPEPAADEPAMPDLVMPEPHVPELHLEDLHLAETPRPEPRPIESFLAQPAPDPVVHAEAEPDAPVMPAEPMMLAEPVAAEPVAAEPEPTLEPMPVPGAEAMLEAFAEMETLGPITTSIPVLPPIPPIPALPADDSAEPASGFTPMLPVEVPPARPPIPSLSTPPAPLVPPMPAAAPAVPGPMATPAMPSVPAAPAMPSVPVVPAVPAMAAAPAAPRAESAAPADQIWQLVDGLNVPPPPTTPAPVASEEHETRRGWRRNKKG